MKKSSMLKLLLFSVFLGGILNTVSSQEKAGWDAYAAESRGYFTQITPCSEAYLLTDNYANTLWLLRDGELQSLFSSPGAGRYYSLSEDGTKIGFKKIDENGRQRPAIYNIPDRTLQYLSDAAPLCGQVDFSGSALVYGVEDGAIIIDESGQRKITTGFYCNIYKLSPDQQSLACNDDYGHILIIDVATGKKEEISPALASCYLPQWSPDSKMVLFAVAGTGLMVYHRESGLLYELGEGLNASWSPASDAVLYQRYESQGDRLLNSDIWISSPDGRQQSKLTNSSDKAEMNAYCGPDGDIIFLNYTDDMIGHIHYSNSIFEAKTSKASYTSIPSPVIKTFDTRNFQQEKVNIMVPGTVPYIHQVYDTPDWHYGYGSCAPTVAMMAIAYFNKLPKWPMTASWPTSHTSDYGNYIADRYRFNEVYYSDVAQTGGGEDAWGGYGYMWSGSYSPNSRMNQYMVNHQLASIEYWTSGCIWDSTLYEINNGWPQPICSLLTTSGHLTLTIGYISGQHTLIFNDPYGNKNNVYMNYNGQNAAYDWPGYNNGYQNLNTVAWTVKADGSETTYNDTIIDDIDYNHGFFMANQPPSHMRYYRDETSSCYNNHYWWTYSNPTTTLDTCWVSWTPTLAQAGYYEVFVYIPGTYATATTARYQVFYSGGDTTVVVNQSSYGNAWVSMGIYYFNAGTGGYVKLSDATGIQGQYLAFDAMKFSKVVTTGLSRNEDPPLKIFPNPAEGETHISFFLKEDDDIIGRLIDMNGRLVRDYKFHGMKAGEQELLLNLNGIRSGTYLLEWNTASSKMTKELIIK